MTPAPWPRDDPRTARLLTVDPEAGALLEGTIGDLRERLDPGDLMVVNDAATFPASLRGADAAGSPVEVRLAGALGEDRFEAVLFGAGDWRSRTDERPPPPALRPGDLLRFAGFTARLERVDPRSPRLVTLSFDLRGAALWRALYRAGRPIQYAHAAGPLSLWHVQTAYAARPWASEAPSAGLSLTWDLLLELRRRGVVLARVTHAAGLSSTGEDALDERLPLAERYEIPEETVRAVEATRARSGRVVAVGTTTARALEGAVANGGGRLGAGAGITSLKLGPGTPLTVVDGILTGIHEPATSHFQLLEAFAPRALLHRAVRLAERGDFRSHEFGDAMLVLAARRPPAGAARRPR